MGSRPQQPEKSRTGHTPVTKQDHAPEELEAHERPERRGPTGPVPEESQPGHQPEHDQDKPDLESFRRRFGMEGGAPDAETVQAAVDADTSNPRSELIRLARALGVRGRSRMRKQDLADAVRSAARH